VGNSKIDSTIPRWRQFNWPHIFWWSVLHGGIVLAPFTFSWSGLAICCALYLLTGIGVTMGYHRLLTHRSFQTYRVIEYLLTLLGSLANQGGPLKWVAVHRIHHQHSDADGDPHSPRHGLWWAHMLWWMPKIPHLDNPALYERYVADLAKDPVHRFLQRWHILLPFLFGVLLFAVGQWAGGLGWSWLVWGMFVRTSFLYHATWLVNSATHLWGYRTYPTRDDSTNLWWVAILTLGEGWHNNHHAFPRSARHGLRWWEIDLTFWLIRSLSWIGLAKQIHVPGRVLRPTTGNS
jgi:stearoyl-CoA desaturase (delta-9 desaturase)